MLREVSNYGKVLAIKETVPEVPKPSTLAVDASVLDPTGNKRPKGWEELKAQRVLAKERAAGADLRADVERTQREYEEDLVMLKEVSQYGTVFQTSDKLYAPKPSGWNELRNKRVHAKERAASLDILDTEILADRTRKVRNQVVTNYLVFLLTINNLGRRGDVEGNG
jgi:hypothetical protein